MSGPFFNMEFQHIFQIFITVSALCTAYAFQGFQRNVVNLPKITSLSRPLTWTSYKVTNLALSEVTICLWVKSTNLDRTGTIFNYVTSGQTREFSLIASKSPFSDDGRADDMNFKPYDVYLFVNGKRADKPITLRIDDGVWHSLCITWNTLGVWNVFLDTDLLEKGENLQVAKTIRPGGRLVLGSGEDFSNRTSRRGAEDALAFSGKVTGLSFWNRSLTVGDIRLVATCKYFNQYQQLKWLFAKEVTLENSSAINRLRKSLIYDWSPSLITVTWPASFYSSETTCANYITVDCTHNHMIISMSKVGARSMEIYPSELHLINSSCTPTARGRYGNRFVFNLNDLEMCGMERKVTDTEVIYINRISNSPSNNRVIFFGKLFESEVRCHYPIDLAVSTNLFGQQQYDGLVFRTPMTLPNTNQQNLEALVLLYQDEAFLKPFNNTPLLTPRDQLYVGVVVKNKLTQNPADGLNIVVDTCWMTSPKHIQKIISNGGCWVASDGVTVLENGRRPQARLKISSKLLSLSTAPVYLKCSMYPCVGSSCTPTCSTERSTTLGEGALTNSSLSAQRRVTKRGIDDVTKRYYDIKVGPLYTKGFWKHQIVYYSSHSTKVVKPGASSSQFDAFLTEPVLLIIAIVLTCIIIFALFIAIILLRKKRRSATNEDIPEPVQITSHKKHSSRNKSSASLSSSVSMSSIGSISSFESFDYPTFSHFRSQT